MRKLLVVGKFAVFGLMLLVVAGTSASATSEEFRLSLKADGGSWRIGDSMKVSPRRSRSIADFCWAGL